MVCILDACIHVIPHVEHCGKCYNSHQRGTFTPGVKEQETEVQKIHESSPEVTSHTHTSNAVLTLLPSAGNAHQCPGSDQQVCFSSPTAKQNKVGADTVLTALPIKVFSLGM